MSLEAVSRAEALNADLRRRLEEAEEVIRAIREGEIDALVVRNQKREEEIFTLEGGVESYRSFMEAMDLGAAAFDGHANLLYANQALCDLFAVSRDALDAKLLFEAIGAEASAVIAALIEKPTSGAAGVQIKLGQGEAARYLQISAGRMMLGTNPGIAMSFTDITARIRAEERKEAERTVLAILSSAAEAVVVCDLAGIVTHANTAAFGLANGDPIGSPFDKAFALDVRGATGLMQGEDFLAVVVEGQSIQGIEAIAPKSRGGKDVLVSASPLIVGDGKVTGTVVTLVDLSRRKAAEKQQLLLMGELDHRVKNTLALVVSISNRTASTEDTIEGFRKAFSGRIHALAATHNVLADRSWSSILLTEILAAELAPYVSDLGAKLKISGEDVEILPRAAIAFGLVIHELATNAVKYGALSNDHGRIEIAVKREAASIEVCWTEIGGPPVTPPTRKGFGDTVINRSLQYSPNGGAKLEFHPEGLRCAIRVPVEDVATV
ncbi:PAS domain S-box-containing protein [Rhizobium sp. BK512]|uniref:sensor histidine kinase n=1 Tax=Rhizobium sp. BK512 TaxID=2587010 RepID=UPI0016112C2E|nr:HWE histidine kinase domain-containing protein [Rhizobium sp. BK512]MBB3564539.1 PAS domain S-box-containing protein [Rhizobium sp. BK512]